MSGIIYRGPVSQELIDDWAWFAEFLERELQKSAADFQQAELELLEKQILGDPDARPVGLLKAKKP